MSLIRDIALRYTLRSRHSGFTRWVARASMLGMILGVASLITIMSVMNGFAGELHARILSLVPHVSVRMVEGQIDDWRSLEPTLDSTTDVIGMAPFIQDSVLLRGVVGQRGATLTGIDLRAQQTVSDLHNRITRGSLEHIESAPFSVALGTGLARRLGVDIGDTVEVTLPVLSVTPMGVFARSRKLTVVAEFEVGADLDASRGWVSLATARRLFARDGVDGVHLQFPSVDQADAALPALRRQLGDRWRLTDWRSTQGSLFAAVQMEKVTVAILLMAVVVVAAFNIVSTLTMAVTEKGGDIAMLRVMGLSAGGILRLFLSYGMVLGGLGIAVGAGLGITLALTIADLALWVERISGLVLFDPRVYYIGRLPSVLEWPDVLMTVTGAVVLTLLAALYPAWRAAHVHPVEALNHG